MRELFYKILARLAGRFGPGFFSLIARGIAAGYFVCFPRRSANSVRFYRALYPQRRRSYHVRCAWRQFQNFTSVFLDRHLLQATGNLAYTFTGRHHLLNALEAGTGGILLMSHLGNWEVGARLLRRNLPQLRLMLYVGRRARDQIEQLQKQDLAASGIRVLAVDQEGGSAFDLVEGVAFMRSGGFVSMAGDLIWRSDQRAVEALFLGHRVRLPEAPYMLAMVAKTPIFVFFASAAGAAGYHFSVSPPIYVDARDRSQRRAAIEGAAQAYADLMERHLRRTPFEWYHFEPFLGPAAELPKKL